MKNELFKFKRSLILNNLYTRNITPKLIYKLTNTPKYGPRSIEIIFALKNYYLNYLKGRVDKLTTIAEFGVAEGEGLRQLAILTSNFFTLNKSDPPTIYGFDSFEGMHDSDHPADIGTWEKGDYLGDKEKLETYFRSNKMHNVKLVKGYFNKTLNDIEDSFCPQFILIDCDYYTSTLDIFENLKNKLQSGTLIYFDDLGTNFYNRNMGEEKVIHEINNGTLGESFHLEKLYRRVYVWSNSEKPIKKINQDKLSIPLQKSSKLSDFY